MSASGCACWFFFFMKKRGHEKKKKLAFPSVSESQFPMRRVAFFLDLIMKNYTRNPYVGSRGGALPSVSESQFPGPHHEKSHQEFSCWKKIK